LRSCALVKPSATRAAAAGVSRKTLKGSRPPTNPSTAAGYLARSCGESMDRLLNTDIRKSYPWHPFDQQITSSPDQ
jgi:hypothetical protein